MRPPRILTGTLAGALTAPLFLLAACGGGDDSVADPPVSPSSTSSSTGTPQRETAEAFIRRLTQAEHTWRTPGRHGRLLEADRADASRARSLIDQVKSIYAAGGFISWSGLTIQSIARSQRR